MDFNLIKDLASLPTSEFFRMINDPLSVFFHYARLVKFPEWLQLYFSRRDFANKINSLVDDRHFVSNTYLDLDNQSIGGENEIALLKQIARNFPNTLEIDIDCDNFHSPIPEIIFLLHRFSELNKLNLTSTLFEIDNRQYIFENLTELKFSFDYYTHYDVSSLPAFFSKMPNLKIMFLKNVPFRNSIIKGITSLPKLEELTLLNCDGKTNTEFGHLVLTSPLKKLSVTSYSVPDNYIARLMAKIFETIRCVPCSVSNVEIELPSTDYYDFEALFYLPNLDTLSLSVEIRDQKIYSNLTRFLSLIPYFPTAPQISLTLKRPINRYDNIDIQLYCTTFQFVVKMALDIGAKTPNFHFFYPLKDPSFY